MRRRASAIAGLRNTLLAEHLARSAEEVGRAVATHGLIGAIERLNPGKGRLRAYEIDAEDGPKQPVPGTALVDPAEPLSLDYLGKKLQRARHLD